MNQGNNFCQNCGFPLKADDKFCKNCGTAINNMQVVNNQAMPNNGVWQNNVPTNSNGGLKYIIIGIALFALIVTGIYFLINGKGNSGNNSGSSNNGNNSSGYTKSVYFSGYTFKIPSNYEYNIEDDILSFGDKTNNWYSGIKILSGDFNTLLSRKDVVISSIESSGYNVNTYNTKNYSGMECIVMEVISAGTKMLVGYVKASSSKIFVVSVVNLNKGYDYDLFETTVSILKTAV